MLARLASIGEKVARLRRRFNDEGDGRGDNSMPRSIQGAFQVPSEAVRALLKHDPEAKGRVIEALDKATKDLKGN